MDYASYQGKLYLSKLTNGVRGPLHWLGDVPQFVVETDSEKIEHQESYSGYRTTDFVMTKTRSVTISATLDNYSSENVALAVSGKTTSVASSTVQDQLLPTVKVGDEIKLDGLNISALMISDSTQTVPVELVEGQHYSLDAKYGKVKFLSLTGLVQPFFADYTTGAIESTTIMSADEDEYYLYFEGVNTAQQNKPVVLELWRVKKQSNGSIPFIHEELGQIEINGDALSDISKQNDDELGLFGRIITIPAVV